MAHTTRHRRCPVRRTTDNSRACRSRVTWELPVEHSAQAWSASNPWVAGSNPAGAASRRNSRLGCSTALEEQITPLRDSSARCIIRPAFGPTPSARAGRALPDVSDAVRTVPSDNRRRPAPLVDANHRLDTRGRLHLRVDVLIEAEHVGRVVSALQFDQAVVVRTVGFSHEAGVVG